MFVADVVIIFIVFIGVSYILFGKKKNVKEDSKFYKTMMNVIFTIVAAIILCPWILMVLFYPIMYLLLYIIPY
ncbi:hypothetical protein JP0048_05430 [Helicobacter pylori]|uniref:hypothetical protein n=1 Tax=Helicobacter pylori TaxID=210 RepID=UPI001AA33B4E|nr:hypothetical protein [Helicobacter pylori]GHP71365.1 hypothetical protein JP0048_05430 [Helicobacter pylori]